MGDINWVQIIAGFFCGGAFGAFIKQFFDHRRNRLQPVGYSIEVKPLYNSNSTNLIKTQITLTEGIEEHKFSNLFVGGLEIINIGLSDLSEFNFGVTLAESDQVIHLKTNSKDRHHIAELSVEPTLSNGITSFDIKLKPFNRKDSYSFDMLITSSNNYVLIDKIKVSTSASVALSKIATVSELALEYALPLTYPDLLHWLARRIINR